MCGNRNIQEVNEFASGVHHDAWSRDLGMQRARNVETLQQVQLKAARLFFWCWHPPPKSVPVVGADRLTSGLASQAQMCRILVQGPHHAAQCMT